MKPFTSFILATAFAYSAPSFIGSVLVDIGGALRVATYNHGLRMWCSQQEAIRAVQLGLPLESTDGCNFVGDWSYPANEDRWRGKGIGWLSPNPAEK